MKRINIKDLAKMLSLNPSTISRALSDHPDISPETKNRVKLAAEEFQYVPNLHAKYFRQKNSALIALILPEFNMFFTPSIMDGINSILDSSGYSIIIFYSNDNYEREKEIVRHCLSWVVEGVLMAISENTSDLNHLDELKKANIPVVLLDKVILSDAFSTITTNGEKAAFDATTHLLDNGNKRIMAILANPNLEISKERYRGYKAAHEAKGLKIFESDVIYIHHNQKTADLLKPCLEGGNIDAAFIMSDELLVNAYPVFRAYGLYPDKISVVAISDGKLPYFLYPNITHMKHSGYEIGKLAAEELLQALKLHDGKIHHRQVPTELVSLASVKGL